MTEETIIAKPGEIVVFKYPGFLSPSERALSKAYGTVKDEMLAQGTPARREKLHPPVVDNLVVPNGAREEDDCILNCIMEQLGINTIFEMTAIGVGAPVRKKRFVIPKSSPRTSVASEYIPKIIPKGYRRLPRKIWIPTWDRSFAISNLTGA